MGASFSIVKVPLVVVMGVSGSGKSTVGAMLAEQLGIGFLDGDSLHPASNVEMMARGVPLCDEDRWPWLGAVGRSLAQARDSGLVVACSALKRSYRDAVVREAPGVQFLHLVGSRELLASRLKERNGHFMPVSLLDSQLSTLEPIQPDEPAMLADVSRPLEEIVDSAAARLQGRHQPAAEPEIEAIR
ncbi:MAG: gluconokinase [Actinomycetota bacterium]|nr:gluconokinase [Actinomycetota bacterium]